MFLISSCSCLFPIHLSQGLSRWWRCSWSSADSVGDAPTTSELSTMILPTKVHLILEVWRCVYIITPITAVIIVRLSKSLATLTLGSSKINQHCWRFHGSGVIAAPQIIGLISFCTGMHHEYFFEVTNVLSFSPFMFENTENKQLDWRIHHSHLASTLFHSLVPWWLLRIIRPQITRLSQLENSAMGTWPIYKNSIIPDWFEKWRDIKFWYRC